MEQEKTAVTFENYANSVNVDDLWKIASLFGIEFASKYKKADIIPIVKDTLVNGKAKLRMSKRYKLKYFGRYKYLMSVIRHFEEILTISHEVSDWLQTLWNLLTEDLS